MEAQLILEDGRRFKGRAFGATQPSHGEICFNTSMTGYQEVLSDPSYRGQIVVMTCPEIGNYGTNAVDQESDRPQVEGFVVREISSTPSNWRANQALPQYLREHGIPGICEVDTRAITRHIRTKGAMRAMMAMGEQDTEALLSELRASPKLEDEDWVAKVSCEKPYEWSWPRESRWGGNLNVDPSTEELRCVAFDFGIKKNILNLLKETGFKVDVVPADSDASKILDQSPDAVFLSNGPGDPAVPKYAARHVEKLVGKVPMFGICLGHQITALALGAKTFKLKFGHRGSNHPVKDLRTGRVVVTSQNHGYAVDPESLPSEVEQTHINLNDQTCEGFAGKDIPLLAVQYHPESSPGPHDSIDLFAEFRAMVLRHRAAGH